MVEEEFHEISTQTERDLGVPVLHGLRLEETVLRQEEDHAWENPFKGGLDLLLPRQAVSMISVVTVHYGIEVLFRMLDNYDRLKLLSVRDPSTILADYIGLDL